MDRPYTFPKYNLDHPNPLGVAGGTAGSVKIDGPSMPSENCTSSCTSTTHPIGLLLVYSSSNIIGLRCLNEICVNDFGVLPNWQGIPQNGITAGFSLELGHYCLCQWCHDPSDPTKKV
jgi:hypothetical protein